MQINISLIIKVLVFLAGIGLGFMLDELWIWRSPMHGCVYMPADIQHVRSGLMCRNGFLLFP